MEANYTQNWVTRTCEPMEQTAKGLFQYLLKVNSFVYSHFKFALLIASHLIYLARFQYHRLLKDVSFSLRDQKFHQILMNLFSQSMVFSTLPYSCISK